MTEAIINSLSEWINKTFQELIITKDTTGVYPRNTKAVLIIDNFNTGNQIGTIQTDGEYIEIFSWCRRYECYQLSSGIETKACLTVPLANPISIPMIIEELFQLIFDYCRVLYRGAIKTKRKHLKPLISEMANLFRQERNKWRATDCQLANSVL